jgi:F420-dependent oxidoreductase-like protein
MKLGYVAGYWASGPPAGAEEGIAAAEELGFDSLWTSEAYGSDAITPLAWWGPKTSKLKLGTAIMQMSARTPAATAMAALTLDHLSGGRFICGIGASGPQVVEGWYGQPFPRPLERTREYVEIMRRVWARQEPVRFEGKHYTLPHPGGMGLGKPLKSTVHPLRADIPVYLAAEGPKNVALAAEIADGWIPLWFSPKSDGFYRKALAEGFARRGNGASADNFDVVSMVPMIVHADAEAAANMVRPQLALYIGGMGARGQNFHYDVIARLGYEDECAHIQDLYLAGKRAEAMAAIPRQLIEDVALVGPPEKIREELPAWKATCLKTILVGGPPQALRTAAELVLD